jgi:hypothetical protein
VGEAIEGRIGKGVEEGGGVEGWRGKGAKQLVRFQG